MPTHQTTASRREAARTALNTPPGQDRPSALEAYARDHGTGIRSTWTLLCEAVAAVDLDDPSSAPSLVTDLKTSIPSRALADLCEYALDNEKSRLKDPRARRRARALRVAADRAVALEDLREADDALGGKPGTNRDAFRRVALLRAHTDLTNDGVLTALGFDEPAAQAALHRAYHEGTLSLADLAVIDAISNAVGPLLPEDDGAVEFIEGTSAVEIPVTKPAAQPSATAALRASGLFLSDLA